MTVFPGHMGCMRQSPESELNLSSLMNTADIDTVAAAASSEQPCRKRYTFRFPDRSCQTPSVVADPPGQSRRNLTSLVFPGYILRLVFEPCFQREWYSHQIDLSELVNAVYGYCMERHHRYDRYLLVLGTNGTAFVLRLVAAFFSHRGACRGLYFPLRAAIEWLDVDPTFGSLSLRTETWPESHRRSSDRYIENVTYTGGEFHQKEALIKENRFRCLSTNSDGLDLLVYERLKWIPTLIYGGALDAGHRWNIEYYVPEHAADTILLLADRSLLAEFLKASDVTPYLTDYKVWIKQKGYRIVEKVFRWDRKRFCELVRAVCMLTHEDDPEFGVNPDVVVHFWIRSLSKKLEFPWGKYVHRDQFLYDGEDPVYMRVGKTEKRQEARRRKRRTKKRKRGRRGGRKHPNRNPKHHVAPRAPRSHNWKDYEETEHYRRHQGVESDED